jgi:8-oxo-dGTP pyrophosphatase MutT (NUDIX family)
MQSVAMGLKARNDRGVPLTMAGSRPRNESSARFVRLSHLNKLCECEQVAAVCYRMREDSIEFLLVRTRGSRRWTFPKGSAEPGLTHAQAAALEAFEEAGVHGRIEEVSFARYACQKQGAGRKSGRRSEKGLAINAHLCQVLRLGKPTESNRNRTWFAAEDARRRLREGRERNEGAEFVRVVNKAVARIQRLSTAVAVAVVDNRLQQDRQPDALQKVHFEAVREGRRIEEASFNSYTHQRLAVTWRCPPHAIDAQRSELLQGEVLQFSPAQEIARSQGWFPGRKKPKALGTGTKAE